jgi:arginyl-tRNA--protein-N-Asp/Glu arginylyltransferase
MTSVPLWMGAPHPCNYLASEQALSELVNPSFKITNAIYSQLIAHGFRRSGDIVYRPNCEQCCQCIPVRQPVGDRKSTRLNSSHPDW